MVLIGAAVYLAATFGCAIAGSMPAMIAPAVHPGGGASAAVVASSAIVRDRFDHLESARVLSTIMLIRGLGPIVAPVVGGLIVTLGGWRSIFWVLGGFGVIIAAVVLTGLEETRTPRGRGPRRFREPLAGLSQACWGAGAPWPISWPAA